MLKTLAARIGVYRKEAVLTPILTMLEAAMEMLMPVMMAKIIDDGIDAGNIQNVYRYGASAPRRIISPASAVAVT